MQYLELTFVSVLPRGYERSSMILAPGNVIVIMSPTQPVMYLDESVMQWRVLETHISEVNCARKED